MSRHDLVSAQGRVEDVVAPLTSSVCITLHVALNAMACMCQNIYDVTSSNILGRLVQCERKGWDRGRWVDNYPPKVGKQHGCVWL